MQSTAGEGADTAVVEESTQGTEAHSVDDTLLDRPETSPVVPEVSEHLEIEYAFDVPRYWSLPRLVGVAGVASLESARRFTQTATYWDTPRLSLLQAKHTLRRRIGGTDAGWHLKKPRAGQARLESARPLGSTPHLIPLDFRDEVAELVAGQALVPVAVLRTRRSERSLLDRTGRALAVLADDSVEATVLRHGERIYRWREVELELVEGGREDGMEILAALTDVLRASGLTVSAHQSKLRRALADELVRLADPGSVTAGEVVLDYLCAQVGVLQMLEGAVRADRPDAVHKARVATRRLRSCLHTFRPLFDRAASDPIRGRVAWLTGALGAPRDVEVIRDHFAAVLNGLEPELLVEPAPDRLLGTLRADHDVAHAALVSALDSRRYDRLMGELIDVVVDPPWRACAEPPDTATLRELVAGVGKRVASAASVAESATDPAVRDEAIHEVRKRAKAARYAAEAAGDVVGSGARRLATAWTQVQEALGDYQDSVVARGVIGRICQQARDAGEDTFTFGVLAERETERARHIRAAYPDLLNDARRAARTLGRGGEADKNRRKGPGARSRRRHGDG